MTKPTIQIILTTVVLNLLSFGLMAQNCHIKGRVAVPGLQGKHISIMNMNTEKWLTSTKIVDSVFTLDFEVEEPFVGYLQTSPQTVGGRNYFYLRIVGEPGNIYADLVTDSLSGTPLNDQFYQYTIKCKKDNSIMDANISKLKEATSLPARDKIAQQYQQRKQEYEDYLVKTYEANKNNPMGALVMEDLLEETEIDYDKAVKLLEGAAPVVTTYNNLRKKLSSLEKLSNTAPGKPFVDLDLTDNKTGKPIKLSKVIKGKVALIDFWASWCGPCRREIPNLAKIHEKYGNNKDFVLISLNVWDNPEPRTQAIKDMKMVWTQLTDATRNATDTYGVDGIPQILLIDKDGTIIARDLRGEEIEKAVKKALGK